ncbi:hypothetical protein SLE2022_106540 [Rubroshorea leprosula]
MQAIKEKINDMRVIHKAKADARAEEQEEKERARAEKELAQARVEVAHEVRKAKEAEAEMELHAAKASRRVQEEIAKYTSNQNEPPDATVAAGAAGANLG